MEAIKKNVGYIRVSTQDQAQNGVSMEAQKEAIMRYAEYNGIPLDTIFSDTGSGKNTERKQFLRMESEIRGGWIGHIVVYKLDRLSRSIIDLLNFSNMIQESSVSLHSVTEKIDTSTSMGRMFFNLIGVLAQFEREQICERTKMALAHKKKQNKKYCKEAPYGHAFIRDKMVEVPQEKDIIKIIRRLKATGLSYQALSDELRARRILSRKGGRFAVSLLHKICTM